MFHHVPAFPSSIPQSSISHRDQRSKLHPARLGEKLKQWRDIRSEYSERRSQFVHVEDVQEEEDRKDIFERDPNENFKSVLGKMMRL